MRVCVCVCVCVCRHLGSSRRGLGCSNAYDVVSPHRLKSAVTIVTAPAPQNIWNRFKCMLGAGAPQEHKAPTEESKKTYRRRWPRATQGLAKPSTTPRHTSRYAGQAVVAVWLVSLLVAFTCDDVLVWRSKAGYNRFTRARVRVGIERLQETRPLEEQKLGTKYSARPHTTAASKATTATTGVGRPRNGKKDQCDQQRDQEFGKNNSIHSQRPNGGCRVDSQQCKRSLTATKEGQNGTDAANGAKKYIAEVNTGTKRQLRQSSEEATHHRRGAENTEAKSRAPPHTVEGSGKTVARTGDDIQSSAQGYSFGHDKFTILRGFAKAGPAGFVGARIHSLGIYMQEVNAYSASKRTSNTTEQEIGRAYSSVTDKERRRHLNVSPIPPRLANEVPRQGVEGENSTTASSGSLSDGTYRDGNKSDRSPYADTAGGTALHFRRERRSQDYVQNDQSNRQENCQQIKTKSRHFRQKSAEAKKATSQGKRHRQRRKRRGRKRRRDLLGQLWQIRARRLGLSFSQESRGPKRPLSNIEGNSKRLHVKQGAECHGPPNHRDGKTEEAHVNRAASPTKLSPPRLKYRCLASAPKPSQATRAGSPHLESPVMNDMTRPLSKRLADTVSQPRCFGSFHCLEETPHTIPPPTQLFPNLQIPQLAVTHPSERSNERAELKRESKQRAELKAQSKQRAQLRSKDTLCTAEAQLTGNRELTEEQAKRVSPSSVFFRHQNKKEHQTCRGDGLPCLRRGNHSPASAGGTPPHVNVPFLGLVPISDPVVINCVDDQGNFQLDNRQVFFCSNQHRGNHSSQSGIAQSFACEGDGCPYPPSKGEVPGRVRVFPLKLDECVAAPTHEQHGWKKGIFGLPCTDKFRAHCCAVIESSRMSSEEKPERSTREVYQQKENPPQVVFFPGIFGRSESASAFGGKF